MADKSVVVLSLMGLSHTADNRCLVVDRLERVQAAIRQALRARSAPTI